MVEVHSIRMCDILELVSSNCILDILSRKELHIRNVFLKKYVFIERVREREDML